MNLSLFKSRHLLVAAALLSGFWLWRDLTGIVPGRGKGSHSGYLLWTGWTLAALYLVLFLYAWRKHAHRLRLTPEFRRRVPREKLERAQGRLSDIRMRILSGELRGRSEILRTARRALRDEGVSKVLRVRFVRGRQGKPQYHLEECWVEPIGRVARWMHAHIFYGLAAAGLVLLHGGGNFSSQMGLLLNCLSYWVIATGAIGIILWTFGPSVVTRRERELSTEKAFVLVEHYARKFEQAEGELREALRDGQEGPSADQAGLELFREIESLKRSGSNFSGGAQSLLERIPAGLSGHRAQIQDLLVLLGQKRSVETEWRSLRRLRLSLNAWRLLHVPATILLLMVVVVHVVSVWRY